MEDLFSILSPFEIYDVSRPLSLDQAQISQDVFLHNYSQYVEGIQLANLVDETPLRPYFSAIFTSTSDVLYAQALSNGKYLVKSRLPVIQLQRHHFIFSETFHSGVMGKESITWGIQFSYPQLFLDPKTQSIGKVEKNENFPNTELFQRLAKWVRNHTSATPFVVGDQRINQPMRLGKQCFEWINHHPSLKEKKLYVANRKPPQ